MAEIKSYFRVLFFDLRLEWRRREWLISMGIFGLVVSLLFDGVLNDRAPAPTLFWALSTMMVIMQSDRSSARAHEQGLGRMRQVYAGFLPVWLADLSVNWLVTVLASVPHFLVLVLPDCHAGLMAVKAAAVFIVGLAALNAATAFPAAIAASLRSRSGLLTILAMPALLIPLPLLNNALSQLYLAVDPGWGWFFFSCGYGLFLIILSAILSARIGDA